MNRLILTDCDGPLLNWKYGFQEWMKSHHKLEVQDPSFYDIDMRYGIQKGNQLVKDFNLTGAFGYLEATQHAINNIKQLAFHGFKIGVITSMGGSSYSEQLRKENLIRIFGDVFLFIDCLPLHDDKEEKLKYYSEWDAFDKPIVWIEDSPENAEMGEKYGLDSYLLNYKYNQDKVVSDKVTRVDSWDDIYYNIINK